MFQLTDIKGYVRGSDELYSLKGFIQPFEPMIMKLASILNMDEDPISAAQDFVHRNVTYKRENGEMWRYPKELLLSQPIIAGDCDDMTILLCSILRNYIAAEHVYVAVGNINGDGHAWIMCEGRTIESTASSKEQINEKRYKPQAFFNDKYAYGMPNEFGFVLINKKYYSWRA